MEEFLLPSPLQQIKHPITETNGVKLYLKREDLIHPYLNGNKFRKLKYNLAEIKQIDLKTIVTFGGAYSNHIYAAAAAGKIFNIKIVGIIRGEKTEPLNPTLSFAIEQGMEIFYLDRENYRQKNIDVLDKEIKENFGEYFLLPEGGTNEYAVKGCEEILPEITINYDYICTAVGTGGTIAGLIRSIPENAEVIGFPALKGNYLVNEIKKLIGEDFNNWHLENDYHFGGYAKIDQTLIDFIKDFKKTTGVQLDPIYTGKMMYGILDMIKQKKFKTGSVIIAIHTGGLQGLAGIKEFSE